MKTLRVYEKAGAKTVTVEKGFNWWAFFFPGPWGLSKGLFLAGTFGLALPVAAFFPVVDPVFVALIIPIMMIVYGAKGNDWMIARLEKEGYTFVGDTVFKSTSKYLSSSTVLYAALFFFLAIIAIPQFQEYKERQMRQGYIEVAGASEFDKGVAYYNGEGVPKDDVQAFRWFKSAAEQGHIEAQMVVGAMFDEGIGVSQNFSDAANWYLRAAAQGNAPSQDALGHMYKAGRGVHRDPVKAYYWLNVAAAQGFEKASDYRDEIARQMTRYQIDEAQRLSSNFRPETETPPQPQ